MEGIHTVPGALGEHLSPVICSSGYDSNTPIFAIEIKYNLYDQQYHCVCNLESLEFTYNEVSNKSNLYKI